MRILPPIATLKSFTPAKETEKSKKEKGKREWWGVGVKETRKGNRRTNGNGRGGGGGNGQRSGLTLKDGLKRILTRRFKR